MGWVGGGGGGRALTFGIVMSGIKRRTNELSGCVVLEIMDHDKDMGPTTHYEKTMVEDKDRHHNV